MALGLREYSGSDHESLPLWGFYNQELETELNFLQILLYQIISIEIFLKSISYFSMELDNDCHPKAKFIRFFLCFTQKKLMCES